MGRMGRFDASGLKRFQKEQEKLDKNMNTFMESCARELAARLLRLVVKRTPVGDYTHEIEVTAKRDSKNHKKGDVYKKKVNSSGKIGGTLRRVYASRIFVTKSRSPRAAERQRGKHRESPNLLGKSRIYQDHKNASVTPILRLSENLDSHCKV